MTFQASMIEGSETSVMRSELTGKDYLVSVSIPYGYYDEPEKKWPVVYHIDGNTYFGMVTEIVRSMAWCGPTSDAIVVGIGYATETQLEKAWNERLNLRYHDLTPVRDEEDEKEGTGPAVKSGGGENFLAFIVSELIPLIEGNYHVDERSRTLSGHSHGGLFTLFAMFQIPGLFKNYVSCSPTLFWKKQIMLKMEQTYAGENSVLPAKLFLSMGELEQQARKGNISYHGMLRLFEQLEERGYEQFEVAMKIFSDEDHCTVIAPSLAAGLKFALRTD